MHVYPLKLDLALTYEIYQEILTILEIQNPTADSSNKTEAKKILKSTVESHIKSDLQIDPPYVNLYFFKVKKDIFNIPIKPISIIENSKISSYSKYRNSIKSKELKLKLNKKLIVNSETSKNLINRIIQNPENYTGLVMSSTEEELSDIEVEQNLSEILSMNDTLETVPEIRDEIVENDHVKTESSPNPDPKDNSIGLQKNVAHKSTSCSRGFTKISFRSYDK